MSTILSSGALALVSSTETLAGEQPCTSYTAPELRKDVEALTLQGIACFESKNYAQALHHYRQAFALSSSPLLEAAIGRSMHELGLWSAARSYYQRYLRSSQARQDRAGSARIEERLKTLERQLSKEASVLLFRSQPTQTSIFLQMPSGRRESLGRAPMALRFGPGRYTFVFERKGYHERTQTVNLDKKQRVTLNPELIPQDAAFTFESRTYRQVGWTTLSVGVPTMVAGAVLWNVGSNNMALAQTRQMDDRRSQELQEQDDMLSARGTSQRKWGQGLFIVGGAGIVVGGVLATIGHVQERNLKAQNPKAWNIDVGPTSFRVLARW